MRGNDIASQRIHERKLPLSTAAAIFLWGALVVVSVLAGSASEHSPATAFRPHISGSVESYILSDTARILRIDLSHVRKRDLRGYLRGVSYPDAFTRVSNFLDSLGHFAAIVDSANGDTVDVVPGPRARVVSIDIDCPCNLSIDSVAFLTFPRAYDAGEIRRLASATIEFLARRGFPFASLFTELDIRADLSKPESPDSIGVRFVVEPESPHVFDGPLFYGEFKTRQKLIRRDVSFRAGEPFNLDKVRESQRRLVSRPYVTSAEAGAPSVVAPSGERGGESGAGSGSASLPVAVPFSIKDKSGLGIDGALAFQSDADESRRLTGLFTLDLLNVFGVGETAMIFYKGDRSYQEFDIRLGKPHLFGWPVFIEAGFGLEVEQDNFGHLEGDIETLVELRGGWQAGVALKGHETADSTGRSWQFYGMDFIVQKPRMPYRAGRLVRDIGLRTGTGIVDRTSGRFYRWQLEFEAGIHAPLFARQVVVGRLVTRTISTERQDELHAVEHFRVGGHNSLRGYADKQFPLKSVGYVQAEYHFYFSNAGSAYIFADGGVGFREDITVSSSGRTDMFGYGIGVRVPVRIGVASIAWARNYEETRSFGRLHVRIQNTISGDLAR